MLLRDLFLVAEMIFFNFSSDTYTITQCELWFWDGVCVTQRNKLEKVILAHNFWSQLCASVRWQFIDKEIQQLVNVVAAVVVVSGGGDDFCSSVRAEFVPLKLV